MASWNPWHGCHKTSPGCANCYVYRGDARRGLDASQVHRTKSYDLPLRQKRDGSWTIPPGDMVWTCFSSDFLLEDADEWRPWAWAMMKVRSDLDFFLITKRIHRLADHLPPDWGEGYGNVAVCSTAEDQERADFRLPILKAAPIRHKSITCAEVAAIPAAFNAVVSLPITVVDCPYTAIAVVVLDAEAFIMAEKIWTAEISFGNIPTNPVIIP